MSERRIPQRPSQQGFTLVEVAVSLFVTIVVLLGVLALFDFSNRLTRAQTNISDMQQSLRVAQSDAVRLIRMAGRGGLPVGNLPNGIAVATQNNVVSGTTIGGGSTPAVVPGSDILTIRGVFTSSVNQINVSAPFTLTPSVNAPTAGTLVLSNPAPSGIPQDLSVITDAIQKKRKEGLLLISKNDPNIWAVVELDPANSMVTNANNITVAFKISGGTNTAQYLQLSSTPGSYPAGQSGLTAPISVGIVEEYRFYVRQEYAVPGDPTSDLQPKLSRARVFPNTQSPWVADTSNPGSDATSNWQVDIADNIFDMQVAFGLDTPANDPGAANCAGGTIASNDINCSIYESADGENDDWMYNGEQNTNPALFANSTLYYIRLTTLARTDRRDKDYQAPILARVEDNTYSTPDTSAVNSTNQRMYRRRLLRTVIDMRNLG